jgi:(p)ppGpp synthase/HD superfamily hydrolase
MKKELDMVVAARDLALKAHKGQFRKDGKTPYFNHVAAVALMVDPNNLENVTTAFLHDILEDTPMSSKDLSDLGFTDSIVDAVLLLTKFDHAPYMEYLKGIKENPIARAVKIADMKHNLSCDPSAKQKEKYAKGLEYLQN